jgi:hypothetical protein
MKEPHEGPSGRGAGATFRLGPELLVGINLVP